MTTRSPPTAASWSADSLLPCPFCAETDIVLCEDAQAGVSDALCTRCGATAPAAAWNHRAGVPPALSARPNEAKVSYKSPRHIVESRPLGNPSDYEFTSDPQSLEKLRAELNEADAPRGQAVACWIDGADIGFLSDGLKSSAHVYPHQALPCMVPLYLAPPPCSTNLESPVGGASQKPPADGVREKYRVVGYVSLSTAETLNTLRSNESSGCDVFAGTCVFRDRSNTEPVPIAIGAGVPDEPK